MADVKGSAAVIGLRLQRIGDERRRIGGNAGVHVVAVVERLGKSVDGAELKTAREAMVHVRFEAVIGTNALRKPVCGIPDRVICEWRVRGARRRGADGRRWNVCVEGKKFVISVRADIADTEGGVRIELPFQFQTPGFNGGRFEIRLHAAGNKF